MNLLGDNAFLGVVAVGLTFVIITGGIDLSVGAIVGCASIAIATLVARLGWHPAAAIALVLIAGAGFGLLQGGLIQRFELPPFLVTLAGMFFFRGLGLWISPDSIGIRHPWLDALTDIRAPVAPKAWLSFQAMVLISVVLCAAWVAKYTLFGRTVYALGGNERGAQLMGLPTGTTKVAVYGLSGLFAALGGVLFVLFTSSGNATSGVGLELDAIATVVIGGTLLTGGYGSVLGTLVGVLILGIVQTAITFDGTLSSWWSKIVTGVLLLLFIVLQQALQRVRAPVRC
jgi:simple sugar transport system permease protein